MSEKTILVPLDGTPHARVALPVARGLAALLGAVVHIVHVANHKMGSKEAMQRIGLVSEEMRGTVLHTHPNEAAAGILQAIGEQQPSYVVLCTHTGTGYPDKTLGRTALKVLQSSPAPLVLVRPDRNARGWQLNRLLLPHDGTPTTSSAIAPAMQLAHRADAELIVLHIAAPGAMPPRERGSLLAPRYVDQAQHEWPGWANEFVGRLASVCPLEKLRLRMLVGQGKPGIEILHYSKKLAVDLIVLAWHGQWHEAHAPALKAVLRAMPCPSLVLRA